MKRILLCTLSLVACAATAAEPWAMWTNFTGADAETGLAPQVSSTQNNIDGGAWRFKLAGEASVDGGGILSTGTTAAPHIDFGRNLDLGYDGNPFTVVMVVRDVGTATGKPLCCAGSFIGTALDTIEKTAGTATIKGMWRNNVWGDTRNVACSVDTLAGAGVTVLATSYIGTKNSGGAVVKTVTASGVTTLGTWAGLKGDSFEAQRIFFGNTNDGTSGGLNFELLAVAIYRGAPADADLTWFADDDAVYTWQGTSGTFHEEGSWKTTPRYACAEDGRSSRTWQVFASNQTSYVAPGRILRFVAPEASGDEVFVGALDAQFAPFDLGGLIVEPGATGYSFASSTDSDSTRTLGLGDVLEGTRKTYFVFHEDFTVNRVSTANPDTTTFYGPVSVMIDEGKTFTIQEEAEVASGATVTVTGGGTLALGKTLAMAGALTIEDGTLSIPNLDLRKVPVTFGENGSLLVSGTLTLDGTTPIRLSALPQTIDLSALTSMPNATYDHLITFTDGATPNWDNVTLSWGDLSKCPDFITVTKDETGLSVKVNRTEDNFIVMPMGDSITEGLGSTASYRKALAERMMAAGMSPRFVGARILNSATIANEDCRNHLGMSSHRVQTKGNRGGYLQGAPNWLEQAGYPDAVTLMIGTNDWINENQGTEAVTAGAATVFERWKALVKTMVAMRPNTWFIVSPITPPRSDRTNMTTYVATYNAHIKSLFATAESTLTVNGESVNCVLGTLNEEGKAVFGADAKIIMASMFAAIPVEGNAAYFLDDIHPNQAGYDRMAAVWLEAIKTLRGDQGGLKDDETIVDAYQTAGAMDKVTVVFNRQQKGTDGVTVTVGDAAAEVSERTLSADGRRVTLKLSEPLTDGAEVTVGKAALARTFTAKEKTAESRVEAAQREGYVAVKALDLPEKGAFNTEAKAKAAFTALAGAENVAAFDRLGYYVTLARPDGALRWLWVTMDRPAAYATVEALGLPTANLRTKVSNLRVASNMPGIEPVTENGVEGLLQFSPNKIQTDAADAAHPASLGAIYDWNTAFGSTAYGYGAMQVFRLYEEGVGRADSGMPASTLFSYSHWALANADNDEITLGDLANHQGYASGSQTASLTSIFTTGFPTLNTTAYSVRRIEIWVRPTSVRTWAGAAEGTWNKTATDIWREGVSFADGAAAIFGALNGDATAATVTVGEAVAPSVLTVEQNAYTFTGATITADALTVAAGASATFESALSTEGVASVAGTLTVDTATFGQTPTGSGTFVKTGESELTLTLPAASVLPAYDVRGGKLTLTKTASGNGAAFSGGTPSFKVAPGAHLVLDANDLVGWTHANTVTVADVSGVLEKTRDANETLSGRLLLKNGGELRNSAAGNFLLLHNSAIVAVEAGAKASITGNSILVNNGTPALDVAENAALSVDAPLAIPSNVTLKKTGGGIATLKHSVSGRNDSSWGTLAVEAGQLTAAFDGRIDGPLTVSEGATFALAGTVAKGGFPVTVNGALTGAGSLTGGNAHSTFALGSTAILSASPGKTLTLTPGDANALSIAAGATVLATADGDLRLPNGYAKTGDGAIAVALPEGDALARGECRTVLTVGEGKSLTLSDFSAPEGLTLAVDGSSLLLANWVTLPAVGEGEEAYSPAAASALSAATPEDVSAITSVTVKTKGGTESSKAVADVNAALECFTGIVSVTNRGEATVAYDFGVANLSITTADALATLRITFKVQGAEDTSGADFAEGIVFAVTDATPGGAADTVLASTADGTLRAVEDSHRVAGERTFTCNLETRTLQLFRVRVQTP